MKRLQPGYRVHILVCTNTREGELPTCGGGQSFYERLKAEIQSQGLSATHWATRTRCLGFCHETGATVVLYRPDRSPQWFHQVTETDFDLLWSEIVRE